MEPINELYQLLFFGAIFFLIRLLIVFIFKFKAFRSAMKENEEEKAKNIVFTLTSQDKYLLLISVGVILAYLL